MKDKSLYQNIEKSINEVPFDTALYYQGTKISFAKLGTLINKAADVLVNRFNIKPGDIVLLAQPNIPHVIILFYALNKIGAIVNLVHPFTPYNQIISIFKKTNTKVAFMFEQRIAKEVHKYRELSDKIVVTRVEDFLPLGKRIIYHAFMNVRIRKK
jgi:long-chain acyl-CoA synthetase